MRGGEEGGVCALVNRDRKGQNVTWALTTQRPPMDFAMSAALEPCVTTPPRGTPTLKDAIISALWYLERQSQSKYVNVGDDKSGTGALVEVEEAAGRSSGGCSGDETSGTKGAGKHDEGKGR